MRKLWPYHLLYVAIAASLLLLWGRIHKHSFYAHYFRTTQEASERNSQHLSDAQWFAWATPATEAAIAPVWVATIPTEIFFFAPQLQPATDIFVGLAADVRVAEHPFLAGSPATGPPARG